MSQAALWQELMDTLHRMSSQERITDADVDEIALLTDEIGKPIPDRFNIVLEELHEDPEYRSPSAIERLLRVLEAFNRVKALRSRSTGEDLLIPNVILPEDAKQRVMLLCAQMRTIVADSANFEAQHKRLLFRRIAAVESQVYQDKSAFDVFRGRTEELAKTIGQVGKDVKPLTDRVREILGIVEEAKEDEPVLPAPEKTKQLPKPDED